MSCPDCIYSLERVRRGEFERYCILVPAVQASNIDKCNRFKRKSVEIDFVQIQPFYPQSILDVSRETVSVSSEFPKKKRGRPKGGKRNALQE